MNESVKTIRKAAKAALWAANQIEKGEAQTAAPVAPVAPPSLPDELTVEFLVGACGHEVILRAAAEVLSNQAAIVDYHNMQKEKDRQRRLTYMTLLRSLRLAESICRTEAMSVELSYGADGGDPRFEYRDTSSTNLPLWERDDGAALEAIGAAVVYEAVAKHVKEIADVLVNSNWLSDAESCAPPENRGHKHLLIDSLHHCADVLMRARRTGDAKLDAEIAKLRFLPPPHPGDEE